MAKKSIFIDYVDNFLDKVFKLIEKYDPHHPIFKMDFKYEDEPPLEWQAQTGFKRYPIITFALERFINIYVVLDTKKDIHFCEYCNYIM